MFLFVRYLIGWSDQICFNSKGWNSINSTKLKHAMKQTGLFTFFSGFTFKNISDLSVKKKMVIMAFLHGAALYDVAVDIYPLKNFWLMNAVIIIILISSFDFKIILGLFSYTLDPTRTSKKWSLSHPVRLLFERSNQVMSLGISSHVKESCNLTPRPFCSFLWGGIGP